MKRFISTLFALLMSLHASASIISVAADKTTLSVGETLNLSVVGNFADFDSFNLAVSFDNNMFEVVTDSLQASTMLNADDFFGAEDIDFVSAVFLSLDTTLSGELTLFTFSLRALSSGVSTLTLVIDEFYDFVSDQDVVFTPVNNTQVTVTEVPVPAMWTLLLMVGTILIARRR